MLEDVVNCFGYWSLSLSLCFSAKLNKTASFLFLCLDLSKTSSNTSKFPFQPCNYHRSGQDLPRIRIFLLLLVTLQNIAGFAKSQRKKAKVGETQFVISEMLQSHSISPSCSSVSSVKQGWAPHRLSSRAQQENQRSGLFAFPEV